MKIFGIAYHEGQRHLVLKSDSSLLNGRKPFFTPETMLRAAVHPCLVYRIGRMGKHIEPRYAWRYINGVAAGLHIEDPDLLAKARENGSDWTMATAIDGSMAIGIFSEEPQSGETVFRRYTDVAQIAEGGKEDERVLLLKDKPEDVIAEISEKITLRQGDMFFIAADKEPWICTENNCIAGFTGDEDTLFCKIK